MTGVTVWKRALGALALALLSLSSPPSALAGGGERVLLIGDSNIYGPLGRSLEASLVARGHEVVRVGKPTSGLARPDFYDWAARAEELLDEHAPDVVIMMFGGNDGQLLRFRSADLGSVFWSHEARWRSIYGARVRELAELLRGDDRRVVLLSPTNRRYESLRERMTRVREVQREAAAGLDRVAWVDLVPLSSNERGRWLKWGRDERGRTVRMRRRDGIHLTDAGGAEVARRLMPILTAGGL